MPLGIYISIPFCKTKCSYCNFASDVFSKVKFSGYVSRVCDDIRDAKKLAEESGAVLEVEVDSIYLGGGTPTVLDSAQLRSIFESVRENFSVRTDAELTVECAPGTLSAPMLDTLIGCGVNRVSLGVQSFVDEESRSVGRLHTQKTVLSDIANLRAAGIDEINVDLIAGLPHQTAASWEVSLKQAIVAEVPHVSVYMLEVDDDSRLGRELIAGGTKYHAHFVPDEDLTADLYERAAERLNEAGILQYEISNFAKPGHESRHNMKYWNRDPYLGFGVDAHSMLPIKGNEKLECVRIAQPDNLETFLSGAEPEKTGVSWPNAWEEAYFLGLRLKGGIILADFDRRYGAAVSDHFQPQMRELIIEGLLNLQDGRLSLTPRGRLLSNEVFGRFIASEPAAAVPETR